LDTSIGLGPGRGYAHYRNSLPLEEAAHGVAERRVVVDDQASQGHAESRIARTVALNIGAGLKTDDAPARSSG
jgi:hypothetical protein